MEPLSVAEITKAVAGKLTANVDFKIDNISTDTRNLKPGSLFIALIGDNFNAHNFIEDAFEKGAKIAIVSQEVDLDKPLIVVEDTTKALQDLASYYRNQFSLPVIAVTGSTGKTTTKDMIAAVVDQKYKTLKSQGNFNNEIGLPLTLFRLNSTHQAVVVEMGMRGLGQIRELAQIAKPNLGVVTNVGVTHIELLGSQAKIAQAKGELIESLEQESIAILNGDDKRVRRMKELTSAQVITYGLAENNQLQAINIESLGSKGVKFNLVDNEAKEDYQFKLPLPGEYNVYNALAAVAVGLELNLNLEEIKIGLENLKLSKMRNQLITTKNNLRIINDAYNANPTSMKAAINTLVEVASSRKIAVLGDMLELGKLATKEHQKIGRLIVHQKIDYLFTIGDLAKNIAQGAIKAGMNESKIFSYQDKEEASKQLLQILNAEDTVLVKGSRGMELEEIVDVLESKE
ncbi:UDP-N-acetylmuramoyl-tripeptide--D-alanyl-D-alanine ligase [Halobacteroides halobius DSM 5150]|uniref:UDP-N-acetylmuramoyl-tripeptide--D-alanyl-D-alanine ligase n=1 Tax=Halobacteroides halobius (strain ATCC 35273 / DSM 5150 / MD-1) TaxID=748449 RepID=L0KCA3_HALHC|nr:UDP-N-acetylmuramoyl-tripeptide--D-alanyl-D-alanine ligase [Halobacteroides halobius]AGB41708.1 UDP-N-acetylmuramoyl-tripeptide--D-alanyl-D-alanine ligase [Halobacteroides halobius DSM 5150]